MRPVSTAPNDVRRRQKLVVGLAALATLLAIELTLGSQGAAPHNRPLFWIAYGVEAVFRKGPDWVGGCIGQVLYSLYRAGRALALLVGPTVQETFWYLWDIGTAPVRGINALGVSMFVAMNMERTEAQAFFWCMVVFACLITGGLSIFNAHRRANIILAQREAQALSQAAPTSSSTSSAKRGKRFSS